MFVHKDTNLLNKKVSVKAGIKSRGTTALIDTGASNVFFHEKWYKVLEEYIELETIIEVQEHGGITKTEIYNVTKHVYIDGNTIQGMKVLFYPKVQFEDMHCTIILGMEYLKKYIKKIQF